MNHFTEANYENAHYALLPKLMSGEVLVSLGEVE